LLLVLPVLLLILLLDFVYYWFDGCAVSMLYS